jgi:hypothetical protein
VRSSVTQLVCQDERSVVGRRALQLQRVLTAMDPERVEILPWPGAIRLARKFARKTEGLGVSIRVAHTRAEPQ